MSTPEGLDEQLWERRVIMLAGRLDGAAAQAAVARLLLADGPEPVRLRFQCPDGDPDAAIALIETLGLVRAPVVALATGTIGGPAVAAYAAAARREATAHARFALSEPRAGVHGPAGAVAAEAALHADRARLLTGTIAAATGRDPAEVAADVTARRVLTTDEAIAYGLVHELATR